MIEQILTGPADSEVLLVTRRYSGSVHAAGAYNVTLQRRLVGGASWGTVATFTDADAVTEFDGEHFVGGSREVEYRFRVTTGTDVHLWLAAPG